jgi:acetate CoA/acetoacetate CoA-transferase beta subunit
MDAKEVIARRIALEPANGDLVNLGIGLPTMVAGYLPRDVQVFFQAENGLIGMQPLPDPGLADEYLSDPGGSYVGAIPGACSFDSCMSFGLIRGGHLDITVLGGLEVDAQGLLANWMVPGKMVPGMGGAMDLVSGARRVIVAMLHTAKGKAKILKQCTLPLTSTRPVSLVVTELAVLEPTGEGLVLKEVAPGVTPRDVIAMTDATLVIPLDVPVMRLAP